MPEVFADGVSKVFKLKEREIKALNGVSFSAVAGEVLAILGANGAGKTTLFNIFANLTSLDSGSISVLGLAPTDKRYYDGISFVSSETQFLWTLSAAQIIKFYQTLFGVKDEIVLKVLDELKLKDKLDRKWHQMSSGEKMRLRIAKGLLTSPKVLFLDEPTVGLDPDIADKLRFYLKSLKDQGMCIILTSHLMLDIEILADRMCFIKNGEIVFSGVLGEEYFKPKVEVVFCNPVKGDTLDFDFEQKAEDSIRVATPHLPQVLSLGEVKEVNTITNDLESLFISLVRESK